MLKVILKSIEQMSDGKMVVVSILSAVGVMAIDYITGKNIEFPVVYALPVGIAAWRNHKPLAYFLAVLLPLARVGFHYPWDEIQSIHAALLNSPITVFSLILYAYLIHRTAWQTRELQKEVKILEGLLPMCASCKKIRNEKGEYEHVEQYISEHSEASFSHGICPECARKLYPECFTDETGQ